MLWRRWICPVSIKVHFASDLRIAISRSLRRCAYIRNIRSVTVFVIESSSGAGEVSSVELTVASQKMLMSAKLAAYFKVLRVAKGLAEGQMILRLPIILSSVSPLGLSSFDSISLIKSDSTSSLGRP